MAHIDCNIIRLDIKKLKNELSDANSLLIDISFSFNKNYWRFLGQKETCLDIGILAFIYLQIIETIEISDNFLEDNIKECIQYVENFNTHIDLVKEARERILTDLEKVSKGYKRFDNDKLRTIYENQQWLFDNFISHRIGR